MDVRSIAACDQTVSCVILITSTLPDPLLHSLIQNSPLFLILSQDEDCTLIHTLCSCQYPFLLSHLAYELDSLPKEDSDPFYTTDNEHYTWKYTHSPDELLPRLQSFSPSDHPCEANTFLASILCQECCKLLLHLSLPQRCIKLRNTTLLYPPCCTQQTRQNNTLALLPMLILPLPIQ